MTSSWALGNTDQHVCIKQICSVGELFGSLENTVLGSLYSSYLDVDFSVGPWKNPCLYSTHHRLLQRNTTTNVYPRSVLILQFFICIISQPRYKTLLYHSIKSYTCWQDVRTPQSPAPAIYQPERFGKSRVQPNTDRTPSLSRPPLSVVVQAAMLPRACSGIRAGSCAQTAFGRSSSPLSPCRP